MALYYRISPWLVPPSDGAHLACTFGCRNKAGANDNHQEGLEKSLRSPRLFKSNISFCCFG